MVQRLAHSVVWNTSLGSAVQAECVSRARGHECVWAGVKADTWTVDQVCGWSQDLVVGHQGSGMCSQSHGQESL